MKRFIKFLHIKNTHPIRGIWLSALCIFAFALFPTAMYAQCSSYEYSKTIKFESNTQKYLFGYKYNPETTAEAEEINMSQAPKPVFECGPRNTYSEGADTFCSANSIVLLPPNHTFNNQTISGKHAYKCTKSGNIYIWKEYKIDMCSPNVDKNCSNGQPVINTGENNNHLLSLIDNKTILTADNKMCFDCICNNGYEQINGICEEKASQTIDTSAENEPAPTVPTQTTETEITETPVDTESTCDLTIRVTDKNGTPISGATVTYNETPYTTDENGKAIIKSIPTNTNFQINISHTGYKSTTYSDGPMDSCPNEPVAISLSAAGDTDTPPSPPQNNGDDNNDPDPTKPDVDLESQRQIDQARINELQENADAMREREQSLANRMIGGASMGAMGIGGMQVASALAEQSADDAAELDMTAYLATFRCDYGAGQNIRGGETNITLPGANILLPLYNEYTTLAADLKSRKESLGMAPGIESETILDATLYDNESIGIADGAYTSLSRALSNPTGADAAEWAAQRAETAEQLKTGAIVAGVGAAVGIAGNILTNYVGDQPRERSAEINAKYDALTELHDNTVALPANVPTTCPNNATGTYPNCQCTDNNHVYNGNLNQCDKCPGNKIPDENGTQCICPSGTFPDNDDNDTCKELPTGVSPKCNPTDKSHMHINLLTGECSCLDGFQPNDKNNLTQCICPDGYKIKKDKCIEDTTPVVQTPTEITIPAENLFELDSAELTDAAKNELEKFVRKFQTEIGKTSEYCITIIGHTDKSGDHLNINQPLSEKRANAVKTALESAGLEPANMRASGVGSTECETTNPKGVDSACRKVEISATNSSCTDND